MKAGIIGFGSIGQRHYTNLQNYTKDVIVLTRRKDLNVRQTVNNWADFKKQGPFDVIFITNETYKHLATAVQCVGLRPKAIFMEKPLSHTSAGLIGLANVIKKEKISFFVGYNFQFYKPLLEVRKIIKNGQLGDIYFMRVSAGSDVKNWRKRDYRQIYSADKRKGGGVMLDFVHDINYPAWLLGQELIPQTAVIKKVSRLQINSEDVAESIFTTKNNTIVSVHQDYLRTSGERSLEIIGAKGTLAWSYSGGAVTVYAKTRKLTKKVDCDYNKMYVAELRYFFKQVKKGTLFTNVDEATRDVRHIEYLKKCAKK